MTNNKVIIFILKALKKVGVLKYLKQNLTIKYNRLNVLIPVERATGYPNLYLKQDCLNYIYSKLCNNMEGTFIDVGVNIGQTLIKIKTINSQINYIGFEPNNICFNYVTKLIEVNKFSNCILEPFALSDRKQQIALNMNADTDQAASIIENLRPQYFASKYLVNCLPLDDFDFINEISFIKIDIEGAELEALLGMKQTIEKFRPLILCEVLDSYSDQVLEFTQNRATELSFFLKELGYIIIQLEQGENELTSHRAIDKISIKQWTIESYHSNDYLFCHASKYKALEARL